MESAKIPLNELDRLNALYSYDLLDTLPEQSYDDLISIAANICGVPISLISLVDKDRCWFKAKLGTTQTEAPRSTAYAAYAINNPNEVTIIEDALKDDRFQDCPLALANPPMRFYAGTPLTTVDGYALGTLCVVDYKPRTLDKEQIKTLRKLANQIVAQFELRKKMSEINQLNEQLNDAYKELETFSYSVSHDLKAPLRGIKGFTQIIIEDYLDQLDATGRAIFEEVVHSATRMDSLIEDILNLSKVVQKKIVLAHINVTAICEKVIRELALSPKYCIKIAPNMIAVGDAKLMNTALDNLIGNATKYSSKKERPIIEIGQKSVQGISTFYIKDNGAGFDLAHSKNIFEPFQRLHSDSEFEGSGIGLAIVNRIIKRHKGKIWADSKIGQGSTFSFSL